MALFPSVVAFAMGSASCLLQPSLGIGFNWILSLSALFSSLTLLYPVS
jgi:hypothetical protein